MPEANPGVSVDSLSTVTSLPLLGTSSVLKTEQTYVGRQRHSRTGCQVSMSGRPGEVEGVRSPPLGSPRDDFTSGPRCIVTRTVWTGVPSEDLGPFLR